MSDPSAAIVGAVAGTLALLSLPCIWVVTTFRPYNLAFYKLLWNSDVSAALKSEQYERLPSTNRRYHHNLCRGCARIPFTELFAMQTSLSGKRPFYRVGKLDTSSWKGERYGSLDGTCSFCSLVCDSLRKLDLLEDMRRETNSWKSWYPRRYAITILIMVAVEPGLVEMCFTTLSVKPSTDYLDPAWGNWMNWENERREISGAFLIQRATEEIIIPSSMEDPHGTTRVADTQLLRRWVAGCLDKHQPTCSIQEWDIALQKPSQVRVIDVEKDCIVHLPRESPFVALSYVWGAYKSLELNRLNENELENMGGLQKYIDQVPLTISDAMSLCRRIGQRYLWVDKLCIIQDDTQDTTRQIKQMDAIYGSAIFTIVAADGTDANAGLAGVRQNSRAVIFDIRRSSHLFTADVESDVKLVGPLQRIARKRSGREAVNIGIPSELPLLPDQGPIMETSTPLSIITPSEETRNLQTLSLDTTSVVRNQSEPLEPAAMPFSTRHPKPPTLIHNTPWFSRAWTFQEWVLSKRLLVSTDDQLFWHCKQSTWCEDMLQRKIDHAGFCIDPNYPPIQRLSLRAEHLRRDSLAGDQDGAIEIKSNGTTIVTRPRSFMAYDWAVQNFTNRHMSYDRDVLAAFQGISRILALCLDSEMFWGLPEALLDSALLWQPFQRLHRRGDGESFPSWSWAGWIGKVGYRSTFGVSNKKPRELHEDESQEERIRCSVRWFRKAATIHEFTALNGTGFGIKSIANNSNEELPLSWHQIPARASPGFWKGSNPQFGDQTLQFWAVHGVFTIRPIPFKTLPSSVRSREPLQVQRFDVLTEDSKWMGTGFLDAEDLKMDVEIEMIVISETQFFAEDAHNLQHELYSKPNSYELYNAMLIRRAKDGTVSRAGLSRVFQKGFDSSHPEVKWIVLR